MLNIEKDDSSKNYISNKYKSHIAYVENNLYKRSGNRTFNNTDNISKNRNQYATDVVNDYKTNKVSNLKGNVIILLTMLLFINVVPYTLMIVSM